MIRVSGVILPHKKHIRIALRSIFGIGNTRALEICKKVGIDPATKVSEIAEEVFANIQKVVSEYVVEGDLRRYVSTCIKRKVDIKCYQGIRHRRGLTVRGQNTRSNAKTRKRKGGSAKSKKTK